MSGERALRWIVTGQVQGVSFRFFTRDKAQRLGLAGWVRNLPDGSVEARVRGAVDKLEALKEQVEQGPPMARVDAVAEEDLADTADLPAHFEIRF